MDPRSSANGDLEHECVRHFVGKSTEFAQERGWEFYWCPAGSN